jgi:hypothetical protein
MEMMLIKRRLVCLFAISLPAILLAATAMGQQPVKPKPPDDISAKRLKEMEKNGMRPPSGPSFFIGVVEGSPLFSILLADGEGKTVTGSFNAHQVEIFEAVVQAAKDFALSDEAFGTSAPITTRLMDQHEWSLFVDVSKLGNKSTLFLSLSTIHGRLTARVGEITRGSKKEQSPLLFDILTRIQNARATNRPPQ